MHYKFSHFGATTRRPQQEWCDSGALGDAEGALGDTGGALGDARDALLLSLYPEDCCCKAAEPSVVRGVSEDDDGELLQGTRCLRFRTRTPMVVWTTWNVASEQGSEPLRLTGCPPPTLPPHLGERKDPA